MAARIQFHFAFLLRFTLYLSHQWAGGFFSVSLCICLISGLVEVHVGTQCLEEARLRLRREKMIKFYFAFAPTYAQVDGPVHQVKSAKHYGEDHPAEERNIHCIMFQTY